MKGLRLAAVLLTLVVGGVAVSGSEAGWEARAAAATPASACEDASATVQVPQGWSLVESGLTRLIADAVAPDTIATDLWTSGDYTRAVGPVEGFTSAGTTGAWVYSPRTVWVRLQGNCPLLSAPSYSLVLFANEWQIIGNRTVGRVRVTTPDGMPFVMWAYDPDAGYRLTTTLEPGQGAWAISRTTTSALILAAQ